MRLAVDFAARSSSAHLRERLQRLGRGMEKLAALLIWKSLSAVKWLSIPS